MRDVIILMGVTLFIAMPIAHGIWIHYLLNLKNIPSQAERLFVFLLGVVIYLLYKIIVMVINKFKNRS